MSVVKKFGSKLGVVFFFIFTLASFGQDNGGSKPLIENDFRLKLIELFPYLSQKNVSVIRTDFDNVFRIDIGSETTYGSILKDKLLLGQLFQTIDGQNLGQIARKRTFEAEFEKYSHHQIRFGKDDSKHKIVVFTDVSCVFCKRFHSDISRIIGSDVQVIYFISPTSRAGSKGFEDNLSVWCNRNRQIALTDAKNGKYLRRNSSCSPRALHEIRNLARWAQVAVTPTIFFEDGSKQQGYTSVDELLSRIAEVKNPN